MLNGKRFPLLLTFTVPRFIVDLKPFFRYICAQMKVSYWLLGAALAAMVVGAFWYGSEPAAAPAESVHVLVQIGKGSAHSITVPAETTALAATQEVADVTAEGEGASLTVTAIDGVAADPDKQQVWKLMINDTETSADPGAYIVRAEDKIHWVLASDN